MKALWREPLFHFVCLGLALFLGHAAWQSAVERQDYTIHVSAAELERQALIFAGENRREPTDSDLKALLFAHVEEQALMREAERLGLGDDDTIIRRRLAQKMRFLIEDVDPPALPDEATLKVWFEANKDRFITPETRSFSHIYLSPETHGEAIEARAKSLLEAVNGPSAQAENWEDMGDPFIMKRVFQTIDKVDTRRVFGSEFSDSVFALANNPDVEAQKWQGPIGSAFGLHLVRLDAINAERIPRYTDVAGPVGQAWQETTRRAQNRTRLQDLIKTYKVVVEEPTVKNTASDNTVP